MDSNKSNFPSQPALYPQEIFAYAYGCIFGNVYCPLPLHFMCNINTIPLEANSPFWNTSCKLLFHRMLISFDHGTH